jgi:hypothetical protein
MSLSGRQHSAPVRGSQLPARTYQRRRAYASYTTRKGYKPQATSKNKLAIAGYLEQYASHQDLKDFMTLYRPDAVDATFSVVTVNGGINNESQPGDEVRPVFPTRLCAF